MNFFDVIVQMRELELISIYEKKIMLKKFFYLRKIEKRKKKELKSNFELFIFIKNKNLEYILSKINLSLKI